MSSTDERRLRRFFQDELVRAARELRQRGVSFFPLRAEPEQPTWYVPGPVGEPEFVEFEAEDCERRLRDYWQAQGLPELARLAGPLLELAHSLELDEEQSADVSPFVYVMY